MSEATVPEPDTENAAVADVGAPVVYARKTAALLQRAGLTSQLASDTMGGADGTPAVEDLLGAVVLMGGAQLAAATAVAEQLGAVLAELRERPEPVESDLDTGPDEVTPGWLVGATDLARLRSRLITVAHRFTPHDSQRRDRLAADLLDALDTWADGQ